MIEDPYKVLGLEPDASADDIKKAYRLMAKKYHPDLHPDDPNITEKMNEINEAYDMLTNPSKYAVRRAQKEAAEQGTWEPVSEADLAAQQTETQPAEPTEDSPEIKQIIDMINGGQYQAAVDRLTQIPSTGRNGRWHYLSALANQMLGNYVLSTEQMQKACELEPQNQNYMQLLMQFQKAGQMHDKKAGGGIPYSVVLLIAAGLGFFLGKIFMGN